MAVKRRIFTRQRRKRAVRRALIAVVLGSVLLFGFLPREAEPAVYPKLSGTNEIRSSDLRPFPKWTGLLERYFKEEDLPDGTCDAAKFNKCDLAVWKAFLAKI